MVVSGAGFQSQPSHSHAPCLQRQTHWGLKPWWQRRWQDTVVRSEVVRTWKGLEIATANHGGLDKWENLILRRLSAWVCPVWLLKSHPLHTEYQAGSSWCLLFTTDTKHPTLNAKYNTHLLEFPFLKYLLNNDCGPSTHLCGHRMQWFYIPNFGDSQPVSWYKMKMKFSIYQAAL